MKKILSVLILFLALLPLVAAPKTGKNPIVIKKGYTVPEWAKTVMTATSQQQIRSAFDIPETRGVLATWIKNDREEVSKCSAVIDIYTQIMAEIVSDAQRQYDELQNSPNSSTGAFQIKGFSSYATSESNEDGSITLVRMFKSPFSFESEVTFVKTASAVTTTYRYLVNGTEKTDKNITYADLAALKNEFNKAFSDLAVKDEGFCTIGYTNTQNKESYYTTLYVLSYDQSGFDKILQEVLTSMD